MAQKQDLGALLNVQQNELNQGTAFGDSLDSRNLAVLGVNVAIFLYAAQILPQLPAWLKAGIFAAYIASIFINILGLLPRGYVGASDLSKHPEYLTMAEDDLVLQLISDTQYAIARNAELNAAKLRLYIAAIGLSVAGAVLLIWGILIV